MPTYAHLQTTWPALKCHFKGSKISEFNAGFAWKMGQYPVYLDQLASQIHKLIFYVYIFYLVFKILFVF